MQEWILEAGTLAAVVISALITYFTNRSAHDVINQRIQDVDARAEKRTEAAETRAQAAEGRAEKRADALAATLEAQRQAMEAIARDLSFLAGRQTERDVPWTPGRAAAYIRTVPDPPAPTGSPSEPESTGAEPEPK